MFLLPPYITLDPTPGPYGEYSLLPGTINVHSITAGRYVGQHVGRMAQDLSVRFSETSRPYGELTGIIGSLWREPMLFLFDKPAFLTMENLVNSNNLYVFKRLDD